jgi:hypothetical protein
MFRGRNSGKFGVAPFIKEEGVGNLNKKIIVIKRADESLLAEFTTHLSRKFSVAKRGYGSTKRL